MIISHSDILDTIRKINNDIIEINAQIAIYSLILKDTEQRALDTDADAFAHNYTNEHLNACADKAYNEHITICNEITALEREQRELENIYTCLIELQNAVSSQTDFY